MTTTGTTSDTVTAPARTSIESPTSWVIATAALFIMSVSFGAPFVAVVALKPIAAELGSARSVPALASSLCWFGSGVGGLVMGRIADRIGVRWTALFGAVMICLGLFIAASGGTWSLWIGHGVFIGFLGNGGINAPLYIYVSRWFDRRRGTALALISSGTYIAGAFWPELFERALADFGWRHTMMIFGVVAVVLIVPASLLLRRPPEEYHFGPVASMPQPGGRVLGWPPNLVLGLLAFAAFLCCVPMAMPANHIVAFCSDLGMTPATGAAMLSVLLGCAFVSRQVWGWVADRIGGLRTVLATSACQAVALTGFLLTQGEAGLFAVSAAFGLGFSGLVPAYVLAIREYFPASEASRRIPLLLLCSGSGMAVGGWLAGAIYDYFGFYAPAFATGVGFNLLNLVIVSMLVLRHKFRHPAPQLTG